MAKIQNITLDELLGMDIEDYRDTISSLSKLELSKVEMVLNDYVRVTSPREVLEYKGALKLNYVRNAKKNKKVLSKVIAKVQEESKQETPTKKLDTVVKTNKGKSINDIPIRNSQNTPKNTGVNYNYQRGQGDLFGKQSKFKFIKQMADNANNDATNENQQSFAFDTKTKRVSKPRQKATLVKVSIENIQSTILKKLSNGGDGSIKSKKSTEKSKKDAPRPTVSRLTKAEKEKISIRRDEINTRKEHLEELKIKHRSDKNLELRKLRHYDKSLEYKKDANKLGLDFRDKIEKQKTRRLNINNKAKEKLLDKAHQHKEDLALIKLNAKKEADKEKHQARLELQQIRRNEAHSNRIEKYLHGIHPAYGLLYGIIQNKKENNKEGNATGGSGLGSLLLEAGAAGGVGSGVLSGGMKALKGASGLKLLSKRLPIVGAIIAGVSEGMSSGSISRGLASGGGAFAGGALGSLAGGALAGAIAGSFAFSPGIGTIIGAILGATLGEAAAKELFDKFMNGGDKTPKNYNAPSYRGLRQNASSANTQVSPSTSSGAIGALASQNLSNQNPDALKTFLSEMSAHEGKSYNTIYGGNEADLTSKTIQEVMDFQRNNNNFPKDENGNIRSRVVGKYQMTSDYIKNELPTSGFDPKTTLFTPEVQDALMTKSLKKAGLDDYVSGKISKEQFGNRVAAIEASLPLLSTVDNRVRGESRYSGIAGNKALMSTNTYESSLTKLRQNYIQKAPSKTDSLVDSTNKLQQKSMQEKSKPINVVSVGGNTTGGSTIINNTYVNPVNTDSTLRSASDRMMMPGRPH